METPSSVRLGWWHWTGWQEDVGVESSSQSKWLEMAFVQEGGETSAIKTLLLQRCF